MKKGRKKEKKIRELTWTCHVCKKERPDSRISVLSTDKSEQQGLPLGTIKQNVRYCNDNPECIKGAKDIDFFKDE